MNVRFMYGAFGSLFGFASAVYVWFAHQWLTIGQGLNPWIAIPMAMLCIVIVPVWGLLIDENVTEHEDTLQEQLDTMLARWESLHKDYMSYCKYSKEQRFELLQQLQEAQELLHVAEGQSVPEDVVCMDKETWGAIKNCRDRLVTLDWGGYVDKFPEGMTKAEYRKQLYERMDILLQDLC